MFNPDKSEDKQVSAFEQMEQACLEQTGVRLFFYIFKRVNRGFVYSRMLWSKFSVIFLWHHTYKHCIPSSLNNYLAGEALSCLTNEEIYIGIYLITWILRNITSEPQCIK